MTALAANADRERKDGDLLYVPVADDVHIYKGALVCADADGYATPATDTAGLTLIGVAFEECDNTLTGHEAGGKSLRVYRNGVFKFAATSVTQASVGDKLYVVDDNTVDETTTNSIAAGVCVFYESATLCWIAIDPAVDTGN